jgi:hypothetical protein
MRAETTSAIHVKTPQRGKTKRTKKKHKNINSSRYKVNNRPQIIKKRGNINKDRKGWGKVRNINNINYHTTLVQSSKSITSEITIKKKKHKTII